MPKAPLFRPWEPTAPPQVTAPTNPKALDEKVSSLCFVDRQVNNTYIPDGTQNKPFTTVAAAVAYIETLEAGSYAVSIAPGDYKDDPAIEIADGAVVTLIGTAGVELGDVDVAGTLHAHNVDIEDLAVVADGQAFIRNSTVTVTSCAGELVLLYSVLMDCVLANGAEVQLHNSILAGDITGAGTRTVLAKNSSGGGAAVLDTGMTWTSQNSHFDNLNPTSATAYSATNSYPAEEE